jgi:hypothetical protein
VLVLVLMSYLSDRTLTSLAFYKAKDESQKLKVKSQKAKGNNEIMEERNGRNENRKYKEFCAV